MRAEKEKKCFRVIIVIPLLPGFQVIFLLTSLLCFVSILLYSLYKHLLPQGGIDDGGAASVRAIMHWQYRTICRGPNSILQNLYDIMGPKAHDYISFYGLRSYGKLCDGGPLATNLVSH